MFNILNFYLKMNRVKLTLLAHSLMDFNTGIGSCNLHHNQNEKTVLLPPKLPFAMPLSYFPYSPPLQTLTTT